MPKHISETQHVFSINGEEIAYVLMRSKKRKRSISMRYNRQNHLQLNVPFRMSQSIINDFIVDKYGWIKSQLKKIEENQSIKPLTYENDELHQFMGKTYRLCLQQSKISEVFLKYDEMLVFYRKKSSVKNILDRWYKQKALEYFTDRTLYLANKHNFPEIKSIKVRNMKARWGSCSSLSEITYNTHLIKTSIECIDYVILHELCHLIHHNHSPRFYQLQSHVNPEWKQQKHKLDSQQDSILK